MIKDGLQKIFFVLLVIVGFFFQLAIITPSGLKINEDILFWSSHGHDSMWHIAVSNEIKKGFPLQNPVMAGEGLVNYHIFSDIVPALINVIFKIPNLTVYFWIMPTVYSSLLGLSAYLVGKAITKSKLGGIFCIFSVYFMGSFGFIVTLLKGRGIGGESLFWASQIQSSIGNPPQILSNILFLTFIYFLIKYLKDDSSSKFPLVVFLTFTCISKIYAAIVILPAIAFLSIYRLFRYKKTDLILVTIFSVISTTILYLPFTKNAGTYLIFEPLWYARKLFSDTGRVGIKNFELMVQHYQSLRSIKSKIGFARYDILGLALILFGNLGVRSLGFLAIPRLFKQNIELSIFLLSSAIISYIIPNIFLQKGVATNTSQTFQYMLLVFGIYFAVALNGLFKKISSIKLRVLLFTLIVALSVPTQIGLLHEFYSRSAYVKIPKTEVEALTFLKNNSTKSNVIMTPPYNPNLDTKEVPPPIWDWFDTAYVAAMSERRVYFADYEQVDIMGYEYESRRKNQELCFRNSSGLEVYKMLKQEKINYIYFPKPLTPAADLAQIDNLQKIFENNEVEIWKVN